jgi:hypothetical protein
LRCRHVWLSSALPSMLLRAHCLSAVLSTDRGGGTRHAGCWLLAEGAGGLSVLDKREGQRVSPS